MARSVRSSATSHGFDDHGRKFDAKGQLRDSWTPNAVKNYATPTAALSKRYSAFSPYPGVAVNGQLTLGENLGDLSGVEAAYAAYQKYAASTASRRLSTD